MLPSILTENPSLAWAYQSIYRKKRLIFCLVQWRQSVSFAQENANCLTTFFSFLIVMMVIPLHDDCYFSDVDVDAYVFISLSSDRRSIWNFLEQLTICKSCGQGNLTPRLFTYCETSISSPLFIFLTNRRACLRPPVNLH